MSSINTNNSTCASHSCKHTCKVCGHKRCHCPRCSPLSSEFRIVSSTRRQRDPSRRRWCKIILTPPGCCECRQQSKPIRFIDVIEKERLTFIEYAGFKNEDLTTKARRSSLSPDEKERLKALILTRLTPKKPQKFPPPGPGPHNPIGKHSRDPDQDDGSTSGASAISVFRAFVPPPLKDQAKQHPTQPNHRLGSALQRTYAALCHLLALLLASRHTRDRALTRISIRHSLRVLSNNLALLTHRLHPELSPLILPDHVGFQGNLRHARTRVQSSWKRFWRVALRLGVLGRSRGMCSSEMLEGPVVGDMVGAAVVLLGELGDWIVVVGAGRYLV